MKPEGGEKRKEKREKDRRMIGKAEGEKNKKEKRRWRRKERKE